MLDLTSQLNDTIEQENQLHSELTRIGRLKSQLQKEIKEAKKLLDWCIETRSDPTQARLSNSDEELKNKMQPSGSRQFLTEQTKNYIDVLTQIGINTKNFTG
jgi:predicted  nucleic acid-binding Zn-ribbon protein